MQLRRAIAPVVALFISAPVVAASASQGPLGPGEWWYDAMGVDELHEYGTGEGIVVAIVDMPLDDTVPDLEGVEVLSSQSHCKLDRELRPSLIEGPEAEHGTGMAVLIAGNGRGTGPGGAGVRGIAPDVQLRHYAVLYYESEEQPAQVEGSHVCNFGSGSNHNGNRSIPEAIIQAAEDGADIINLSVSTGYSTAYDTAVLAAHEHNAILVSGTAGGTFMWPSMANGVLVVNPIGQDTMVSVPSGGVDRSNMYTSVAAPAEAIAGGGFRGGVWDSGKISNGSSNATAIVSGGLAAMWSAHPSATANQIVQAAVAYTGVRPGDEEGRWKHDFRRVEGGPTAGARSQQHGYGIFAPADAVRIDPTTLPDEWPLDHGRRSITPVIDDINAALEKRSPEDSPAVRMGLGAPEPTTEATTEAMVAPTTETDAETGPATEAESDTETESETESETETVTSAGTEATSDAGFAATPVVWAAGAAALVGALILGVLARRARRPHRSSPG